MDTAHPSPLVIEPSALWPRIGSEQAPWLLDVRRQAAYDQSPYRLAAALRCPPEQVAAFANQHAPREVVVYCVHGHQVSFEAVRQLRHAGWPAFQLAGGMEGGEAGVDSVDDMARWRAKPLPRMQRREDLGVDGCKPSRWVSSEPPSTDQLSCSWLIRHWIDPLACFWWVPAEQVHEEARRLDATVFALGEATPSPQTPLRDFASLRAAFGLNGWHIRAPEWPSPNSLKGSGLSSGATHE